MGCNGRRGLCDWPWVSTVGKGVCRVSSLERGIIVGQQGRYTTIKCTVLEGVVDAL